MIGSGLKKLAQQHGLFISGGVAYGSLHGFATTLSEGSDYKRIDISTRFAQPEQANALQAAINAVDVSRTYRVQTLQIGPRSINIIFNDTVGTMKKIEAFIAWFYPLLVQYGAANVNVCLECGGDAAAGGWYLIDGIAYHFHDSCAQHVQADFHMLEQQRAEEDDGSYVQGLLGALGGAALGAVVWAIVLYAGYVASIVGLLIGWLADKGYNLLHGKQGKGKIVILILAIIFGVLLGTIVPDVITLAQMIGSGELEGFAMGDIPYMIIELLQTDPEYRNGTVANILMGLFFAALGTLSILLKAKKETSGTKMKKLN